MKFGYTIVTSPHHWPSSRPPGFERRFLLVYGELQTGETTLPGRQHGAGRLADYVGLSQALLVSRCFPIFLLAWLRLRHRGGGHGHWVRRCSCVGEAMRRWMRRHDRRLLFWESFLGNFLFSICMLYGVLLTSAVAAGVIDGGDPGGGGAAVMRDAARAHQPRVWAGHRLRRGRHRAAGAGAQGCGGQRHPPAWPGWATCCCWARCSARPATW
jgi:hypothetical protein